MTSEQLPTQRKVETISRGELVAIVNAALPGDCASSTKKRLRWVAENTEAFAVGWFHCDGVTCPARQASRTNQRFQEAFDRAMGARFGRDWNDDPDALDPFPPFVVKVR